MKNNALILAEIEAIKQRINLIQGILNATAGSLEILEVAIRSQMEPELVEPAPCPHTHTRDASTMGMNIWICEDCGYVHEAPYVPCETSGEVF